MHLEQPSREGIHHGSMHVVAGENMSQEDKEMFADSILQTIEYFLAKWGTAEQYALSIGLRSHELLAIKRNILAEGRPETLEVPDLVDAPVQPD